MRGKRGGTPQTGRSTLTASPTEGHKHLKNDERNTPEDNEKVEGIPAEPEGDASDIKEVPRAQVAIEDESGQGVTETNINLDQAVLKQLGQLQAIGALTINGKPTLVFNASDLRGLVDASIQPATTSKPQKTRAQLRAERQAEEKKAKARAVVEELEKKRKKKTVKKQKAKLGNTDGEMDKQAVDDPQSEPLAATAAQSKPSVKPVITETPSTKRNKRKNKNKKKGKVEGAHGHGVAVEAWEEPDQPYPTGTRRNSVPQPENSTRAAALPLKESRMEDIIARKPADAPSTISPPSSPVLRGTVSAPEAFTADLPNSTYTMRSLDTAIVEQVEVSTSASLSFNGLDEESRATLKRTHSEQDLYTMLCDKEGDPMAPYYATMVLCDRLHLDGGVFYNGPWVVGDVGVRRGPTM